MVVPWWRRVTVHCELAILMTARSWILIHRLISKLSTSFFPEQGSHVSEEFLDYGNILLSHERIFYFSILWQYACCVNKTLSRLKTLPRTTYTSLEITLKTFLSFMTSRSKQIQSRLSAVTHVSSRRNLCGTLMYNGSCLCWKRKSGGTGCSGGFHW